MIDIKINITNKIATAIDAPFIVCGNCDYTVTFDFDAEWDAYQEKTARFLFVTDGIEEYIDVLFSGNTCNAPVLPNIEKVIIGVFTGDLRTTTGAEVRCKRSILFGGKIHLDPPVDVYNQILEIISKKLGSEGGTVTGDYYKDGNVFIHEGNADLILSKIDGSKSSNLSDYNNDVGFVTNATNDLVNYYSKSETYTQAEINNLVSTIPKFNIEFVTALPTTDISAGTVYLVLSEDGENDLYTEYIYVDGKWEVLGTQKVDLSGYYDKGETDALFEELETVLGNLEDLNTTNNTSLVDAINDALANDATEAVGNLEDLQTEAKQSIVDAVNENAQRIGDLEERDTNIGGGSGIYTGDTEPTDPNINVWLDTSDNTLKHRNAETGEWEPIGMYGSDEIGDLSNLATNDKSNLVNAVNELATDYIIEQGTNGVWTYEKWASGKVKCWGVYTTTATGTASSVFGHTNTYNFVKSIPFPSGLFSDKTKIVPNVNVIVGTGYTIPVSIRVAGVNSMTVEALSNVSGEQTCSYYCNITGTWK